MEDGRNGSPAGGGGGGPTAAAASQSPKRPQATTRERMVETREIWTEGIQGLDNLSLAVNSLDDHMQAGLQEVRNCVNNLRREKTELVQQVRTLGEAVREVTAQREHYKETAQRLNQEVASLKEEMEAQRRDKERLLRRMEEQQDRDEHHLESIGRVLRSKRLAHSTIAKWRRRVRDRTGRKTVEMQVLEEENSRLRAELLLCQEAAKQAFLRSANALNSEAITMFQDAATRRLGDGSGEDEDQERPPSPALSSSTSTTSSSSSSSSSSAHPQDPQEKGGGVTGAEGGGGEGEGAVGGVADKENMASKEARRQRERELAGWYREEGEKEEEVRSVSSQEDPQRMASGPPREGERNVLYSSTFRNHRLTHASSDPLRTRWKGVDTEEYEEVLDSGSFSHCVRKPSSQHQQDSYYNHLHHDHHRLRSSDGDAGDAGGGALPTTRLTKSDLIPDTLQHEARTRLRQLQRERHLRMENMTSIFEPQRKTKRVMTKTQTQAQTQGSGSPKNTCTCQIIKPPATYKCPYCTPIQNSSFGHHKATKKIRKRREVGEDGVTGGGRGGGGGGGIAGGGGGGGGVCSFNPSTVQRDKNKRVIYNPNACTVLIEKHTNK